MAIPIIDLDNQTASPITLSQLGLVVPASSSLTGVSGATGDVYVQVLLEDRELHVKVDAGDITFTVDGTALTVEQTKTYLIPHDQLESIKHNLAGGAAPTVTDDKDAGYSVGSTWFDLTNDIAYSCFDAASGAAVWAKLVTASGNVTGIFIWGNSSITTAANVRYLTPGFGHATTQASPIGVRMPRDGAIRNMYVRHNVLGGSTNTIRYTVEKNGVASALTLDLASNVADASETSTTVAVTAGDLVSLKTEKPLGSLGGGGSPSDLTVTVELA
jgi:hypothetical protein